MQHAELASSRHPTGSQPTKTRAAITSSRTWPFLALGVVGGVLGLLPIEVHDNSADKWQFILLTYALFYYLLWEVWRITREQAWRGLLQPPVLASVLHFTIAYVLPNVRYFADTGWVWLPTGASFVGKDTYRALNTATLGVLLGAFAMWRGYRSSYSAAIGSWLRAILLRRKLLRGSSEISFGFLGVLILVAVGAWLTSVELGIFGYSSDAQALVETRAVTGWIKVASDAGALSLLVLAVAVHSPRYARSPEVWVLFVLVLLWQVAMGFLSGFKSAVVMPFITVAVAYYAAKGRISKAWILAAALMLLAAFRVVDSFRDLRVSSREFDGTSLQSIASTVARAGLEGAPRRSQLEESVPAWQRVLGRQDLITFTAEAIAFEAAHGTPPNSPEFLTAILLAPVNAYVPRVFWPEKSISADGYWFNVTVLGAPASSRNSVGMGPVGYLNFAGGFPMVFIGFLLIGGLQRITWESFRQTGLGGWIVYLSLLTGLAFIPTSVGGFFAGFLRQVPFSVLAQYLVLRRQSRGR